MNHPPNKLTILRNYSNGGFTLIAETYDGLQTCDELAFDEMLGVLARVYCPTFDDGTPNRKLGRALFLNPPKP